jgi:hypothetical protein
LTTSIDPFSTIRRMLLAILLLGLLGTGAELILISHYEDSAQRVPIFFIALALATLVVQVAVGGRGSLLVLRVAMAGLLAVGALGVVLHSQGSMAFQLEMDPTLSGWALALKVLQAKAPPTLAPGVMAQLGLLGLVYTYRHPAGRSS